MEPLPSSHQLCLPTRSNRIRQCDTQDNGSAISSWRADDEPPPLAHFLRAIDQAQMESLPSVNKDSVGVPLGSFVLSKIARRTHKCFICFAHSAARSFPFGHLLAVRMESLTSFHPLATHILQHGAHSDQIFAPLNSSEARGIAILPPCRAGAAGSKAGRRATEG